MRATRLRVPPKRISARILSTYWPWSGPSMWASAWIGTALAGWWAEDVSDLPRITAWLLRKGYTEQQIAGIWECAGVLPDAASDPAV